MPASLPPQPPSADAWDLRTQEGFRDLHRATAASSADVERLRHRIAAAPPSPSRWPLAVAAGLVFAGAGAIGWAALRPAAPLEVLFVDGALTVDGEQLALADGRGDAMVDGEVVRLEWVVGTLRVEDVAAGRLLVVTPEGEWLVGGAGVITRDRLGTHGREGAELSCLGEQDAATCLPVHAAGWLGRAHALVGEGDLEAAQGSYEAARDHRGVEPAVRAEAWAGLADVLVRGGDVEQAAVVAERALAEGAGTREEQLHMLAARAYLMVGDCGAALPHLEALPDPTAEEAEHAARCEAQLRSPE